MPYATAGDCQRNPHCLHGLFSVSLNGTDFRVASGTNWVSRAGRGHLTINRHYVSIKNACSFFKIYN